MLRASRRAICRLGERGDGARVIVSDRYTYVFVIRHPLDQIVSGYQKLNVNRENASENPASLAAVAQNITMRPEILDHNKTLSAKPAHNFGEIFGQQCFQSIRSAGIKPSTSQYGGVDDNTDRNFCQ